jgi:hypothetical protein
MRLTGQDKLNEALHNDTCDDKWTLRVNDPCNATKLDQIKTAIENQAGGGSSYPNTAFDVPAGALAIRKVRSGLVDTYSFYEDDLATILLKTITITYDDLNRINYVVTVS